MGVDYRGYYGIGYRVEGKSGLSEEACEDGLEEYISGELNDEFDVFATGNAYSGEVDGIYIVIIEPFKDGYDLTQAKLSLDAEIDRLNLEPVSSFSDVGGLYVF